MFLLETKLILRTLLLLRPRSPENSKKRSFHFVILATTKCICRAWCILTCSNCIDYCSLSKSSASSIETFRSEDEYKISSAHTLFPANSVSRGQLLLEILSSRQRVCLKTCAHAWNLLLVLGSKGLYSRCVRSLFLFMWQLYAKIFICWMRKGWRLRSQRMPD